MLGQFAATSQFYLFGKRHCTQTGYQKHAKRYSEPNVLETVDLAGKVFLVTGANQGIGKEITQFLASHGGTVYMVCRNVAKAEAARHQMMEATSAGDLRVLQADCSLQRDVHRCWKEFAACSSRLDGLVCNAGALLHEKAVTDEGVEVTFASHLLFGTYLLGSLALPMLAATEGRLVIVSSGGMYNVKFPDWDQASGLAGHYNGEFAYAYAKRGQVLLAERWASQHPVVKVVSCHPGWADTDGVHKAYNAPESKSLLKKSYLEPLRTVWEGSEGICWLLACRLDQLQTGSFYLDRKPQVKHMAGPFFSEGNFTKNSEAEIDDMMHKLKLLASGQGPPAEVLRQWHDAHVAVSSARSGGKLQAMQRPIDLKSFMGKWFVVGHMPTFIDKNIVNAVEEYEWNETKQHIDVKCTYMNWELTKESSLLQTAKVANVYNTEWKLSVKLGFVGVPLSWLIIHCEDDYSACIVGSRQRRFLYIMSRRRALEATTYERLKDLAESVGYDRQLIAEVCGAVLTWGSA